MKCKLQNSIIIFDFWHAIHFYAQKKNENKNKSLNYPIPKILFNTFSMHLQPPIVVPTAAADYALAIAEYRPLSWLTGIYKYIQVYTRNIQVYRRTTETHKL